MAETVVDLAAGGLSGLTSAVAGYPLETILVLMQSHKVPLHTSYRSCVTELYRREGIAGFYKGIPPRLLAASSECALTFGGYKASLRLVGASEEHLTLLDVCAGGLGGGLATTAVLTPLELIKCRLQVTPLHGGPHVQARPPLTLSACVRHIYQHEGGLRGFYQGGAATITREVPGTALLCGANDLLRECMTPPGRSVEELPLWATILCGGLSGLIYSVFLYPVDLLKTRIQTEPQLYRQIGFVQAMRRQYRVGGIHSFYRGFGLVALCSFPSSALVFTMYVYAAHSLTEWERRVRRNSSSDV